MQVLFGQVALARTPDAQACVGQAVVMPRKLVSRSTLLATCSGGLLGFYRHLTHNPVITTGC